MYHKVIGRPIIVFNTLLFNILVSGFFYVSYCLSREISCLDLQLFTAFIKSNSICLYLLILSTITTIKMTKISGKINIVYYLYVIGSMVYVLNNNFDKLVFVLVFVLTAFVFYFSVFWNKELSESYNNAKFDAWDLNERKVADLNVTVFQNKNVLTNGVITNWNGQGCYIRFDAPLNKIKNRKVDLKIQFSGKDFHQLARPIIANKDGFGCGFMFLKGDENDLYNWDHLYAILYDRSYLPEYLM